MMATELKCAVAGAGFFAQFHADGWRRTAGVRMAAVADPDEGRKNSFADQWSIPQVYASVEEMLDHEKPDFLDIVTRPESHLSLTELAASRGIPVICQKPMAPAMEDCQRMVDVCRRAGVRLVIHENWRWQPWYREIHRLAEAGRIGRIFHAAVRMRTGDGRGRAPYAVQPYFREMPRLLIYETLVHFLDTLRFLVGEIEAVSCVTERINRAIQGEDYALIRLRFRTGVQGVIDANRISGETPPPVAFAELHLEGTRAAVRLSPDGRLWLAKYPAAEAEHMFDSPDRGYKGDSVRAMQQHFVECLQSGEEAESEGSKYLKTVAAVEACYRSAAAGGREEQAA